MIVLHNFVLEKTIYRDFRELLTFPMKPFAKMT